MSEQLLFVDALKKGGDVKLRSETGRTEWIDLSADELDDVAACLRWAAERRDSVAAKAELVKQAKECNRMAEDGSNDEEIQTLQETVRMAFGLLGLEYPDGTA